MKKALLIAAGVVLAIPVLAVAAFLLFFDANAFRPRLAEAVQRATGREFRIEGPLRLSPALTPTIAAEGLVLAGPLTLADCHLGPMLRAFALAPAGAALLATCPALDLRRRDLAERESLRRVCVPVTD